MPSPYHRDPFDEIVEMEELYARRKRRQRTYAIIAVVVVVALVLLTIVPAFFRAFTSRTRPPADTTPIRAYVAAAPL